MKIREMFPLSSTLDGNKVGIEIEMEGVRLPRTGINGWKVTRDGSLRGGYEYVLENPILARNLDQRLETLWKAFSDSRSILTPSDRCGVHVHINCQNNTLDEVLKFACLYLILEDVLVHWCGEKREGNMFCLRSKDAEALIEELVRTQKEGQIKNIVSDSYRYASINFVPLKRFGSLEFRALDTPIHWGKIKKWAQVITNIKQKALEYSSLPEMVEDVSMTGEREFVEKSLGKFAREFLEDEYYPIFDGVRRVQDIAYTKRQEVKKKSWNIAELQEALMRDPFEDEGYRFSIQQVDQMVPMDEEGFDDTTQGDV